jgi:hypothetical protein
VNTKSQKLNKKYAHLYILKDLHDAIQLARKENRRYNGRLFSNALAFELGAEILLGVSESEEDILKQKLGDLEIQQHSINSQTSLINEQLERLGVKKDLIRANAIKEKQDAELLASKIIDFWDYIALYGKKEYIDFIVAHFEGKLTRDQVAVIFPLKYEPAPTFEKCLQMASALLDMKEVAINVQS